MSCATDMAPASQLQLVTGGYPMRIQETDKILKEARYARRSAAQHEEETGVMSRAWSFVQRVIHRTKDRK